MATAALRQEVDELREFLKDLSYQSMRTELSVNRLSQEMRDFKDEMRVFKDEMGAFKDEMGVFKDEMGVFKDEMSAFKDEMSAFKDEMREFKDEMGEFKNEMLEFKDETVRDRKRMNKQWGDLANRLGTLVEDIVAPNLPRAAVELLGCEHPSLFAVRVVRHWHGETREYDALVVCNDAILVNETKSKLLAAHVDAFVAKLEELPLVFPEYAGRRVVGVLASLAVDTGMVAYATRCGVAVLAMGEDTMQIINPEAVRLGVEGFVRP